MNSLNRLIHIDFLSRRVHIERPAEVTRPIRNSMHDFDDHRYEISPLIDAIFLKNGQVISW